MSVRLTRRGAITLAVAGFLAPALVITASSALLTTTNSALSANSVSTTACSTSAWNTLLTGFGDGVGGTGDLTAWNPFDDNGAGLWNGGQNNNAAFATSGWITGNFSTSTTKPTVNSSGALYCSSSTAATLASTSYFQSPGKTNDGSPSGTATTSTWNLTTGTNTLAVWFQTSAATGGVLASLASGTTYVDRALWVDSTGNVAFGGRNATAGWKISSSGTDYTDGRWHLAAAVMGTTGATLYVDGVQQATNSTGGYYATANGSTSTTWRIGTPAITSGSIPTSMPSDAFIGSVDEFALLHTGLTAGLLSQGYSSSVSTVAVAPPTDNITTATVGTRKTATSVSLTPPVANATSVSITPNTSITSASIAPHKAISSSTITPQKVVSALTTSPQATIAASIIPQKAISALGLTPQTSITSAVVKPNADISSASIAPHKAISSSSLTPQRAINTASVTPVASISSAAITPVATLGTMSITPQVSVSRGQLPTTPKTVTALAISSATVSNVKNDNSRTVQLTATCKDLTNATVTCGGAGTGFSTGDWVYVNVTCGTCATGYAADINGWKQLSAAAAGSLSYTLSATKSYATGAGGKSASGSAVQDTVVATAAAHGFTTSDTFNMAVNNAGIDGTGYTPTAVTTNSITFDLNRTTTTVPTTTVSNTPATAAAVKWATTATITADNSFAVSDSVTVAGFSGGSPLNGTFTITSATSTAFTFTVTAYNGSVDFNPVSGTATVPENTLNVVTTSAHQFTSGKIVTLAVPSTVTNYTQLNAKTCTVLASPTITSTTFSCTLSAAASANVSLTSTDAATATVGLTTLPITTAATHSFASGDTVVLAVPSTVTNYAQVSGKTCLVLASPTITSTTFSCTLSSAATSNVSITSTDGATASPQKGIASASLSPMSSISAASLSPVASITSATVSPKATITSAVVSPRATVTAASLTAAGTTAVTAATVAAGTVGGTTLNLINHNSTTVQINGVTCKNYASSTVTCGATSSGWDTGDWVYVSVTCASCSTGYATDVNGWQQLTAAAAGTISFSIPTSKDYGKAGGQTATGTLAQDSIQFTSASHGLVVGNTAKVVGSCGTNVNATAAVTTQSSTSLFTYDLDMTGGMPASASSCTGATAATAQKGISTVTITSDNTFANGNAVAIAGTNNVTLDGTSGTIAGRTATTFTYNLATPQFTSISVTGASGSATVAQTVVTVTAANHGYATGNSATIATGNATIDGTKTITVVDTNTFTYTITSYSGVNIDATGTATVAKTVVTVNAPSHGFTTGNSAVIATGNATIDGTKTITVVDTNTFTYTITSYNSANISASGTATVGKATLAVTTTAAHSYVSGNVLTLAVPNTVTNYDQLNAKTCTVLVSPTITSTTFSCTLSSAATQNITLTSASAATVSLPKTVLALTTSQTHGFVSGDVVSMSVPSTVTNYDQLNAESCTVLASPAPTATGFSCTLTVPVTKNITLAGTEGATVGTGLATLAVTTTAAHGFVATNTLTLSVPNTVANYDQIDGQTCTVLASPAPTSTGFSCTLSVPAIKNVAVVTGDSATASRPVSTLAVTTGVTHGFVSGNVVGLTVPSTVTNYDQLNGQTCTVLASPVPTTTGFSCTLGTAVTKNITIASGDDATADFAQTKVTVTATAHGYSTNDSATIATGNATLDGAKTITVVDTNTFTYTIGSYTGANIDASGTANVAETVVTVTDPSHGYVTGNTATIATGNATLDGAKSIIVVDTNTFTYTIASYSGVNIDATGTATVGKTTLAFTTSAAHSFVATNVVTLEVPSTVTNYDQLNGKTCTVLASPTITSTTFSCTLSAAATKNVTLTSGSGATAALGLTTLAVTTSSTHPYVSGNVATLAVPSTVTNYDQLNGKTCTVLNSPTITSTTFSCTLAVAATKNVTVVSGDAATATVGQTTMAITTSAAHGFTSTNVVTLAVPSTVTNYDQLNGKTCTVLASPTITSTTFSCTLSVAATKNVTLTASGAATAALPLTTLAVTTGVTHNFVATNVVGLTVPSTVTNYDQLNGKTCTVLASPAPTPTTFSCTLSTGAAKNVTLTTGDGATADFAQTLVTVNAPGHGYVTGNTATIATGTPTIDGAKAVTVVDANTFTYTITSYSGANIDATGTATLPKTTVTVAAAAHGFTNGDKVTIATGNATLDGAKTIAGVTTNSFTYTISSYNGANLTPSGTATKWITLVNVSATAHGFAASQAVTLSGTGVAALDNQTCTLPATTPATNTFTCNLATSTDIAASASAGYASIPGTTVTVVSPNTLAVSDTVNIAGAGTPFNVTGATIVSASSTQFTYTVASTAYTQSTVGTWLKPITQATLTTTAAHNLSVGDHITISGSSSPFNGDFTVTSVPSTTTLTFDLASAASAASSSSAGTVNGASLYVSAGN